jgi:hypothetical protein
MPTWAWVLIGIAIVLVIGVAVWQLVVQQRRRRLRDRFGPEYDRTVRATDSRRDAEADLREREEHRSSLEIRPLAPAARDRYRDNWQTVQAEFVDNPTAAVAGADSLIQSVMIERGYPVEDFDRRTADISVDHPDVVQNYRQGHGLAQRSASGEASTEDLRQAMTHYRALFVELLEDTDSDTDSDRGDTDDGNGRSRSANRRDRERTGRR